MMLEDKPMCKGLAFANRHVSSNLCNKYGKSMEHNPDNCEAAPVSILAEETFAEDKRSSLAPHKMAQMCSKQLVRKPPLSARDVRLRQKTMAKNPPSGSLA